MARRTVPLAAADMAAAMRGRIVSGDPATVPGGFSIDSRSIARGQAFFAIVAERDDRLGRRVRLLRSLLQRVDSDGRASRVWIEGLPSADAPAALLLDELARR